MINRRQLGRTLAIGIAAGASDGLTAQEGTSLHSAGLSWSKILPGIWKTTIGTPEAHTPVRSRLIPPAENNLAQLPEVAAPPLASIEGIVTDRGCVLRIPMPPGELVYGFGLQLLSFSQRGKKKTIRVNADPKLDTGDSHAPVPFYVTTRGYGLLVDSARHVDFYCGDARRKPSRPELATSGAVNTPDTTRKLALQDPGEITIEVPRAKGVDVYLFAGPSMKQVVQRYNLFAGGGLVPPEWGLGFWYRAEQHGNSDNIKDLANEFRERKIPCDVIGLEPGWQTHAYSCSFAWDSARFADPRKFVGELADHGFQVNLWEHAFTHPSSPLFEALLPYSGDYGVWGGLVPDFAAANARQVFGDYHGRTLVDIGISGFKLDECDSSDFTGGWSFPDFSRFPSGLDGEQMHAVFGLRYQDAIWQQFKTRRRATYSLVRSSGALATPYPFVLYSDLYEHRDFIRALVNSGFTGLLWCPEVRDAKNEEDLVRRLESVVFSPLAMVNAWYIKNPPWKQIDRVKNNADQLEANWQALEARCREIIGWRMQLVPYLLSAFQAYGADGTPPFRALILDHPNDPNLANVDDEYMIGDRMLVAPLFAGEADRSITLPQGTWCDFWTGKPVEGGSSFSVPGTAEKIPVFVKSGSVLPLAEIGPHAGTPESRRLTVKVYGDGSLAWQGGGPAGQGLTLSWDQATRKGNVRQAGGSARYTIARWEQMA
ncbi:MAG: TIM-barrel domain-containing protein [Bryobacteraceae bacterium]